MTIVIPYRNRYDHFRTFTRYMGEKFPQLPLVIVEQMDGKPFNRGALVNIGAQFAFIMGDDAVAIHDIDKLPIRANYNFPVRPRQLVKSTRQPVDYLGGVTLFNKRDFEKVNGFSNNFWGWGGEDNDLMMRCKEVGLRIDNDFGTFHDLPHPRPEKEFDQSKWDQAVAGRPEGDGYSNVFRVFAQKDIIETSSYTLLKVDL